MRSSSLAAWRERLRDFFHIKQLNLLVARAFIGPFLAGFSVTLFILVLQFLAKYQDDLFGKGLGGWTIAELFGYTALSLVVVALALGILLSSLMCLGALGETYQLAALKASGISLWKTLQPLVMLVAGVTAFAFWFSFYVVPWANLRMFTLLYDAQQSKPVFALKPGMFNPLLEGFTLRAGSRSAKGELYDVQIYDHSENRGEVSMVMADSGTLSMDERTMLMRLKLQHGTQYQENAPEPGKPNNYPFTRIAFDTLYYSIDVSGMGPKRSDDQIFASHQYMLNVNQLRTRTDSLYQRPVHTYQDASVFIESLVKVDKRLPKALPLPATYQPSQDSALAEISKAAGAKQNAIYQALNSARSVDNYLNFTKERIKTEEENARAYHTEYHLRFTLPVACLLFLFIGAPLGAIIRKGGLGLPIVISVGFFIFFYVLMTYGKKFAREGVMPVWVGVWLPVLVMLPMALFVSYQSATDSRLFDLGAWKLGLPRLFRRPRAEAKMEAPVLAPQPTAETLPEPIHQ